MNQLVYACYACYACYVKGPKCELPWWLWRFSSIRDHRKHNQIKLRYAISNCITNSRSASEIEERIMRGLWIETSLDFRCFQQHPARWSCCMMAMILTITVLFFGAPSQRHLPLAYAAVKRFMSKKKHPLHSKMNSFSCVLWAAIIWYSMLMMCINCAKSKSIQPYQPYQRSEYITLASI